MNNKTLNQLLTEMHNYNSSEVKWAARAKSINVFVFISKDGKDEADLNGRTPFGDMQTIPEVYERLINYFGGRSFPVHKLFAQPYSERERGGANSSDQYFFEIEEDGHQYKVRVTFWTY